jgi:hypothetical protein
VFQPVLQSIFTEKGNHQKLFLFCLLDQAVVPEVKFLGFTANETVTTVTLMAPNGL